MVLASICVVGAIIDDIIFIGSNESFDCTSSYFSITSFIIVSDLSFTVSIFLETIVNNESTKLIKLTICLYIKYNTTNSKLIKIIKIICIYLKYIIVL